MAPSSSASITRAREPDILAAPSKFKHCIELPPDPDDFHLESFEGDDEDVEMQRYLEQIYTSKVGSFASTVLRSDDGVVGDLGFSGLGLIETRPDDHRSQNLKHKLKVDETTAGRDKHRKQGRHFEVTTSSNKGLSSTRYQENRDFVEGRSEVRREGDVGNLKLKGFDTVFMNQSGELEELDIDLIRPEEQRSNDSKNDSMDMPPKLGGKGKEKGKSKEVKWRSFS